MIIDETYKFVVAHSIRILRRCVNDGRRSSFDEVFGGVEVSNGAVGCGDELGFVYIQCQLWRR